jgi:hypothetical protein
VRGRVPLFVVPLLSWLKFIHQAAGMTAKIWAAFLPPIVF